MPSEIIGDLLGEPDRSPKKNDLLPSVLMLLVGWPAPGSDDPDEECIFPWGIIKVVALPKLENSEFLQELESDACYGYICV
jgi:hypothetical protein